MERESDELLMLDALPDDMNEKEHSNSARTIGDPLTRFTSPNSTPLRRNHNLIPNSQYASARVQRLVVKTGDKREQQTVRTVDVFMSKQACV